MFNGTHAAQWYYIPINLGHKLWPVPNALGQVPGMDEVERILPESESELGVECWTRVSRAPVDTSILAQHRQPQIYNSVGPMPAEWDFSATIVGCR